MTSNILSFKLLDFHPKLLRLGRLCYLSTLPHSNAADGKKEEVLKKIIYSSKVYEDRRWNRILQMRRHAREKSARKHTMNTSIALKYLSSPERNTSDDDNNYLQLNSVDSLVESPAPVMPIGLKVVSADNFSLSEPSTNSEDQVDDTNKIPPADLESSTVSLRKVWTNDYMRITHKVEDEEQRADSEWVLKYGTSNRAIPSSHIPCGGCGALLHCKDTSIPGFIPQELFRECKTQDLRTITCQRCYFLQNHNTALSIAVDAKVYPKIISYVKRKKALLLLAVDLTDFPCSIWPGISDLVGLDCPMFLVGNKVDLLCGDSKGWMDRVEKSLRSCFPSKAKILGTQLISAKTGFGVEELITKLQKIWQYQGDVYLVGCTNVGKSTLFNALLQSDYCKVKAADLVQRATTSPWPGTTLNLLKFPIMRPEGWRTYLRSQRLKTESNRAELHLRHEQARDDKSKRDSPIQLIGHIGRTFHQSSKNEDDPFSSPDFSNPKTPIPGGGLNPNDPDFVKGRWFYDTPGVLHDDQILDLLTTEELVKVLHQKTIEPRTVIMKPGWTLFVGGLARVDYLQGESKSIRWTVFVSRELPITICFTEDAQEVYETLLESDKFVVPHSDAQRLKKWPSLKFKDEYKFSGVSRYQCCGDVVLSSCGWVSFAANEKEIIRIRPWTPEGRGIYTRFPALLPFTVNNRGILMKGTPAFSRPREEN
uniref:G domain-containing protein n=1 Tax=Lygus hesperus TaxID=30085 RepID=A0A0K8T9Y4_LYGHE